MLGKITIFLPALLFSWSAQPVSASPAPNELDVKLSKRVTNYNLDRSNFVEALVRVSSEFEIPMGIAWVNTPTAKAEMAFAWKDATVQQVIEAISKTQPGYRVQLRNGVVHISSPGFIANRENFLTLKIKTFAAQNESTEMALLKLHDLITPRKTAGISIGGNMDPKITLELKDSTVQDILDALVVASARKIWIVTFSNEPTLTATGFRRSMSLWSQTPSPEPAWDLLHWGDKVPWSRPGGK